MPYGFGATFGTGSTDIITTSVPVPVTMGDRTAFYVLARGYALTTGGGDLGRFAVIHDNAGGNALYNYTTATSVTGSREGAPSATVTQTATSYPRRIAISHQYAPAITTLHRICVNGTTTTGTTVANTPVNGTGAAYISVGNHPGVLTRCFDGFLDEVAVFLTQSSFGFGATAERRWHLGYSALDTFQQAEGTLVFYADGKSTVNLIDGNPLIFSGAKIYNDRANLPVGSYGNTNDLIPFRPSNLTRSFGDAACGWPQISRQAGVR